ncbi:MAG: acyl-CoA/acyl-ACP dehydrogenase [Actinobacteria bacterium]|nr:acyl-CoA/acyl-ACP dehydrogenase [Actinomycetota bacterium]
MHLLTRPFREGWIEETDAAMAALGAAHAAELRACEREGRFPAAIYREMAGNGWVGTLTPVEHGGLGAGPTEYCVVAEGVGRHGLVTPQTAAQGQRWLLEWGSDEQQRAYLPAIASGELVFSESISEPGVGSSFKQMRATARRDGGDWVINGSKTHVNLGCESGLTIVYVMVDGQLTSFLVETDVPGVETTHTHPIGLRMVPTADVTFTDVRVPAGALLGEIGGGMATFLTTFNLSRLGNASELIGLARRALVEATDYARERPVGDGVVTDFQAIQWKIADCYDALYAASLARDRALLVAEAGEDFSLETSLAKKLAIDAGERVSQEVFALLGGHSLYREQPFEQILADIKVLRVAGGSHEILRNYVARRVLKSASYEGLR